VSLDDRELPWRVDLPPFDPARKRAIGDRVEAVATARHSRRRMLHASAGLLAAAAAVGLVIARRPPRPARPAVESPARLRTGPGEYQLWPVGDRAVAFVCENTELERLPGDAGVRILGGQARFVVSRDPGRRSFVVRASLAEVAVEGTEFDVSARGGYLEVRVMRGEVEVRNPQGRRQLWAGEAAHVRAGEGPRMVLPVRGMVTDDGPVQVRTPRTRL
jgi:ferric-dicitrate binding protein FerR (iron transport regulator)